MFFLEMEYSASMKNSINAKKTAGKLSFLEKVFLSYGV